MRCRPAGLALLFILTTLFVPLAAEAQPAADVWRIGVLASGSPEGSYLSSFRDGLRELGYVEGKNVAIEWRWARGQEERFPDLAAELVRLKIHVIVANNNAAIAAAQKATRTIPIVMVIANEPVALGFVASFARPGGNITGMSLQDPDQAGKRIQLLKEAVPKLSRLALLWDSTLPGIQLSVTPAELAARELGIKVQLLEVRSASELDGAFAAMTRERADAARVFSSGMLFSQRARIAELAVKHHLPTICTAPEHVEAGCLMSYAASFSDLARRAAYFVDRILKGAKPADLPVEQPTKFKLVINLKTAKALGLTIPQSLLGRADEIIQ
jgi:putative ABC transport system substrate-binding protein